MTVRLFMFHMKYGLNAVFKTNNPHVSIIIARLETEFFNLPSGNARLRPTFLERAFNSTLGGSFRHISKKEYLFLLAVFIPKIINSLLYNPALSLCILGSFLITVVFTQTNQSLSAN